MSSQCLIKFHNNPNGIYSSGEKVSGEIQLITTKLKLIRAIYITITGFAEVKFLDSKKLFDVLGGDEEYFFARTLVEGTKNGESFDFLPGTHSYNFDIELPKQLPTSFDSEFGQIRYEVILTIDRAWKYNNIFKHPFTVIHPLNLNENKNYKKLLRRMAAKKFLNHCMGTTLLIKVDLPYSGFTPGQVIPYHICLKNSSYIKNGELNIKLIRHVKYKSTWPTEKTKEIECTVFKRKFKPNVGFRNKRVFLPISIPSVPPSTLDTCKLIEVSYSIHLKAMKRKWSTSLEMKIPITVGTSPIAIDCTNNLLEAIKHRKPESSALRIQRSSLCFKDVYQNYPHFENYFDNQYYTPKYPFYFEELTDATAKTGHNAIVAVLASLKIRNSFKKRRANTGNSQD